MLSPELYDMLPMIFSAFFVIYGVLMIVCPKPIIKKEWKEDEYRLAKMKKGGILVIICGIALFFIQQV
ncbi:MAG: hypothetical protein E7257_10190 [Lachnospiraceae bacterium]|nr:hypothetical protein [Lachnospiraceae bacterium]